MYLGDLGNVWGAFFLWFSQGLITASYKTIKSKNTVFVRGVGESSSGNGGGWVWRLSLHSSKEGDYQNRISASNRRGRYKFRPFCDDIIIECYLHQNL